MKPYFLAVTLLALTGCELQPVFSYQHQSDPRIANDGYDFVCAGVETNLNNFRLRTDACKDLSGFKKEAMRASVEYRFSGD